MTAVPEQSVWRPLPQHFRELAAQAASSVLLESAKPDGTETRSLLFLDPFAELIAWTPDELKAMLVQVDAHLQAGAYVAGYFEYECGEILHQLPHTEFAGGRARPLAWLGIFKAVHEFEHWGAPEAIPTPLAISAAQAAVLTSNGLGISRQDYRGSIGKVQQYLEAGHSYQVNFTDRITGHLKAAPEAVYAELLRRQPVSFAAFLRHAGRTILSCSPELFYRTAAGRITVRPMKGTWPRGVTEADDQQTAQSLRNDPKNRSEHVTIVDLLRNDVGRIAAAGSVTVDELFSVERYQTLLQMTSTISATLDPRLTPSEIFKSLFPSGSITGAPKRRTMQIIRELEAQPRGVYTGAIGYFAPGGNACFNVAIRTLDVTGTDFTMGVGGGITLDSVAGQEYDECCLKSAFLTADAQPFALLETMRSEHGSIIRADLHLERLSRSARYFQITYDSARLRFELKAESERWPHGPARIRLLLNQDGSWDLTGTLLDEPAWAGRILISAAGTQSYDKFLHHKTTHRQFYDARLAAARAAGFDEVLFLNERGCVTEGAISNIFARLAGFWVTPALACGVLPGIGRALALKTLQAEERQLTLAHLLQAERITLVSALRGPREVRELHSPDGPILWTSKGR